MIKEKVRNYILSETFGDKDSIKDDTLIFDSGLLDSMGLLFLIEFLKEELGIEVEDDELNPENFETINSIVSFVEGKMGQVISQKSKV